jgi:endogenous inhibitor of DNA gyrase (YacG/DUF329 family)
VDEKVPCAECGQPVSAVMARQRNGLCFDCRRKHEEKVACAECGKPVSAKLAIKRDGLCLQCHAKRNPFFVLAVGLIDRVCNTPGGFDTLSDAEKLYYALTLFQNEVNNGGFHQFFFNSSGAYYDLIESGLVTFDEPQALELLHQARQIVFPDAPVPVDTETRREQMRRCAPSQLDELDRRFYACPDTLTPKLQAFARQRGLAPADSNDK